MIVRTKAFRDGIWSDIRIVALVYVNELNGCVRECHAQDHYIHKASWNGIDLGVSTDVETWHFFAKVVLLTYTC